jgi:hypothetical protein
MKYFLRVFIVVLFVSSCHSKQPISTVQNIIIDNYDNQYFSLDSLLHVDILPLKTDTTNFIGTIQSLCFIDDYIYVLDGVTSSIFVFNRKDGYVYKRSLS